MKARINFTVSIIADLDEETCNRLKAEIDNKQSTSLDIAHTELSYLDDKTDKYIYIEQGKGYEEDYTQLQFMEILKEK